MYFIMQNSRSLKEVFDLYIVRTVPAVTATYHKMVSQQNLGFLDLFIWVRMETLSHLWVTSTSGEQEIFV